MKERSQVSLKQIAAATNLSISTVSRVLRNKGETRQGAGVRPKVQLSTEPFDPGHPDRPQWKHRNHGAAL